MARRAWDSVLQQIHSLADRPGSGASDADLLGQFLAGQDEAAFAALLRRHGPMVLRVARRVLGSETDAEDVFQATFLLLARRAGAIRKRGSVASFLHAVAHRLALSARSKSARRQAHERQAAAKRPAEAPAQAAWGELEGILHEVLKQLPEKYRTPLVCCYLEGRTQQAVARQLGLPLGTLRSQVARGREMLRKRLLRRGISLTASGSGAALLASACADAAVPPALLTSTAAAARQVAAGRGVGAIVSARVSTLLREGTGTLLLARLKCGAVSLLVLALLAAGGGRAVQRHPAAPPADNEPARREPAANGERPQTDAHGDPLPPGAVRRLGTVRFRHEGWVEQVAVSPDGRTLAATAGKSVVLWDIATGRRTRHFSFSWGVYSLALAPDGKSLAVGGEDCNVHLFDLASGKETRSFVGHNANKKEFGYTIKGLAFSPDGQRLVSWGNDKTVRVWQTQTGEELRRTGGTDWAVWAYSPAAGLLAVRRSAQNVLRLWDVMADREVRQLPLTDELETVEFSPDGKTLALSANKEGQPGRIVLWDVKSGEELGRLTAHTDAVRALAFSPDGRKLASGGRDQTLRLWDVGRRKQVREARAPAGPVYPMAWTPDGKTLVTSELGNHVRLWDSASWRERQPDNDPDRNIGAMAYSPDGELLAALSANTIWLWEAATGDLVGELRGHSGTVSSVAFSADGRSLVSAGQNNSVCFWDTRTGKQRKSIWSSFGTDCIALSADGKLLAGWGSGASQAIELWDTTGKQRPAVEVPSEQPGVRAAVCVLAFSPDGKILYAASGTHLHVLRWDTTTGKALPPIGKHDGGLNRMALSADGRSLAALTMDGTLYLWETATGQARLISKDAGYATSVALSPDGRLLALVNSGTHRLWRGDEVIPRVEHRENVRLVRAADGKVVHSFAGHLGGVNCVRFSSDGRTLASGGQDTTVLLWDVSNRSEAGTKKGPSLTAERLAVLWTGMSGTAAESHRCMIELVSDPARAVPFLGEKLKPVTAVESDRFARLLKKLESDQFREREEATRELRELGEAAEPALRKALADNLPLETRRRLQALLEELDDRDRQRTSRAIEVLEHIGDEKARGLLRQLSEAAARAWLTEEAAASLRRLERTATSRPANR